MSDLFNIWLGGTICQAMSIVTYASMTGTFSRRDITVALLTAPAWPVIQLWGAVKSFYVRSDNRDSQ